MANKYDLKIKSMTLAHGDQEVLGVVPDGKTRFVCFIKIGAPTGDTVKLAANVTTATLDAPGQKDVTTLAQAGVIAFPDKVDVGNPLFSIAEKLFLNANAAAHADNELTIVYFDE